nr:hypothetical protein [uncultured Cellulosilyticum sp.]
MFNMFPYVDKYGLHCSCGKTALEVYFLEAGMRGSLQIRCINHEMPGNVVCCVNDVPKIIEKHCLIFNPNDLSNHTVDKERYTDLCKIVRKQLIESICPRIKEDEKYYKYIVQKINNIIL